MEAALNNQIQTVDRYRLGGNIVRSAICFSEDEKTFFCCAGSVVKTYNVATGALLGVLEGHTARVSAVMVNPNNNLQIFTTSHDGTIRRWDYIESSCLEIIRIRSPIIRAQMSKTHIFMNVDHHHYSRSQPEESIIDQQQNCAVYSLEVNSKGRNVAKPELLFEMGSAKTLAISNDHQYLASVSSNVLTIFHIPTHQKVTFEHKCELTTVAFHPNEPMIATGDVTGRIIVWVNYLPSFAALTANNHSIESGNNNIVPIPVPNITTFHWHSNAVTATAFSEDGTYIISGGEEAVLVFWQLETGNKQFLPRLGQALLHITTSPRGSLYAVACADNAIRMVNAVNNKIIHTIQGLQYATNHVSSGNSSVSVLIENEDPFLDPSRSTRKEKSKGDFWFKTGESEGFNVQQRIADGMNKKATQNNLVTLVPHPQQGHIVIEGKEGHLQVYDTIADQHVGNIAVVDRNYLARNLADHEKNNTTVPTLHIEQVSFSPNGNWMVTVDKSKDSVLTDEESLKIWMKNGIETSVKLKDRTVGGNIFNSQRKDSETLKTVTNANAGFTLNTRAENIHKDRITSIVFHPTEDIFVTTSADKTFKVWSLQKRELHRAANLKDIDALNNSEIEIGYSWASIASGEYRNSFATHAAFSTDGSVLAVAFGQVVTLWAVSKDNLVLKTTLVHPPPFTPVRFTQFINDTPFLVSVTHTSLYVWNILTCSVAWSYHLQTAAIVPHPELPYFAALIALPSVPKGYLQEKETNTEKKGKRKQPSADKAVPDRPEGTLNKKPAKNCAILVFHAENPTPIRVIEASDAKFIKIKSVEAKQKDKAARRAGTSNLFTSTSVYTGALAFLPRINDDVALNLPSVNVDGLPLDTSSLVYVNRFKELIRIPNILHNCDNDQTTASTLLAHAHDVERRAAMQATMKQVPSVFSLLYNTQATVTSAIVAGSAVNTIEDTKHVAGYNSLHTALQSFLKTPSHVLGSMAMVYKSYMDAFLHKKQRTG